jgi:peptidoglycan/LPS O-acetylase OafA/YrhL
VWLPPAILLAGGFAGKVVLAADGVNSMRVFAPTWDSTLSHSLIAHADLFGFGMCAAVLFTRYGTAWAGGNAIGRILAYTGVPWLVLGYYFVPPYVYESGVATLAAVVLLRVLHHRQRLLETRVVQASGRISYSVFLWNFPLLAFMSVHRLLFHGGPLPVLANFCIVAVAVTLLSLLSYRYVEAPALRLKKSARTRTTPTSDDAPPAAGQTGSPRQMLATVADGRAVAVQSSAVE